MGHQIRIGGAAQDGSPRDRLAGVPHVGDGDIVDLGAVFIEKAEQMVAVGGGRDVADRDVVDIH